MTVILPVVNAPFHLYYGYNWLREDNVLVTPPQVLPPEIDVSQYGDLRGCSRLIQPL